MTYCSKCSGDNPQNASYCQHCGTNLEEGPTQTICGGCGGENRLGALYCRHCGASLTDAPTNSGLHVPSTKKGGRLRKIMKWGGIGCGGFIALFVILIIIASICGTPDDTGDTRSSPPVNSGKVPTTNPIPRPTPVPTWTHTPPTATPMPTPRPTATPTPAPIRMELADLLNEYDLNKVRANTRLRYRENGNLLVSTSGYVSNIEELYVNITPDQDQYAIQELYCYYADTKAVLELTKGQLVSVTGKIRGTDGFTNDLYMFACEFEGIHFEKNPMVTAHELRNNVVQVFCTPSSIFSSGYKGTGVIIDANEGIVLTVHHVVADENECKNVEVELPGVENRVSATTVTHCASIDRARLRISTQDIASINRARLRTSLPSLSFQPIFRATAPAQTDQEVYFWGYGPGELRMGAGIVVDVFGKDVITDAYAVPGDSGSPVFDGNGHLLGTMSRSNRSDRAVFTGDEC